MLRPEELPRLEGETKGIRSIVKGTLRPASLLSSVSTGIDPILFAVCDGYTDLSCHRLPATSLSLDAGEGHGGDTVHVVRVLSVNVSQLIPTDLSINICNC